MEFLYTDYFSVSMSAMEEGCKVLDKADPTLQESLISENVPDPMDAEQTWPTAEELAEADLARKKKIVKHVPKGMSEYQAAWIPDSDGGEFKYACTEKN
jgi:pre-rRNA-processing protein TSR1